MKLVFKSVKGNVPHQGIAQPSHHFQAHTATFRVSTLCSQHQRTWKSSNVLWSMVAFSLKAYIYICIYIYLLKYS